MPVIACTKTFYHSVDGRLYTRGKDYEVAALPAKVVAANFGGVGREVVAAAAKTTKPPHFRKEDTKDESFLGDG